MTTAKRLIVGVALLVAVVLCLPVSAQVRVIQAVRNTIIEVIGDSGRIFRFDESGGNLLLQTSNGGAFSTVGTFTSAGQLLSPDGTISAPMYSFANDTNTGQRNPGNQLYTVVNGADRSLLDGSGLGLGQGAVYFGSSVGANDISLKRLAASSARFASASDANTYDITLADWGTTLSAKGVSVANDASIFIGTASLGLLNAVIAEDFGLCAYLLGGGGNAVVERDDVKSTGGGVSCSPTKDAAGSINIFYDAAGASGAGYYLQNKRGATRTVRALLIGA